MLRRLAALAFLIALGLGSAAPVPAQTLEPADPSPGAEALQIPGDDTAAPGDVQAAPSTTGPTSPAPAPARNDAYSVSDIQVDVSAGSTEAAREQAFAEGQRRAFAGLLDRLSVSRTELDPASVSDAEIGRMVRGFTVDEERTSPGRYAASLTYTFQPDAVRQVLRQRAVTYSDIDSRPVLVLPVLREGGADRLWDSPNPWLEAWLDTEGGGTISTVVPFGDLADVRDVPVEAALEGDREAFARIQERYGAGDTLVTVARPEGGQLTVSMQRYGAGGGGTTNVLSVQGTGPEAYADAVRRVTGQLEADWRQVATVQSGTRNSVTVLVPFGDAATWFQTRLRLSRVPTIETMRVISLSRADAVVALDYLGTEDQLRNALTQQNLRLDPGTYGPELRRGGF
ncbi:MAG: DUF2066 domain-containing protein [Azospirillaceae bacterium]